VAIEALMGGRRIRVTLDYDDLLDLHESAADSDIYFKLQYRREGYGNPRICPGGYVSKQLALYRYAHRWRLLRQRTTASHDVLGRFGRQSAQDVRRQAIQLLQGQSRVRFYGGISPVWWGEYMDEIVSAHVCLDLPGRGELCHRLIEYMAVGACVIGPDLKAELPVPPQPGVHLMRVPRNLEGLLEWCERLLGDAQLRNRLQQGAADYFDRFLAIPQLGAYYVNSIWRGFDNA
jgi:hypothetical protein